ncbi:MAG: nucleoside hydrolase [Cytophagales bacterium]|nr:nucleoside hydrolase [Cytophagales bacterium]
MKQDFIFDMETSDPDDVLTLCLLANHKYANLRAVTVTPGTNEQIGLVKHVLKRLGLDIPVGGFRINDESMWVSPYYYKWLGKFQAAISDDEGYKIIQETIKKYPNTTVVTGAPLKNFT